MFMCKHIYFFTKSPVARSNYVGEKNIFSLARFIFFQKNSDDLEIN